MKKIALIFIFLLWGCEQKPKTQVSLQEIITQIQKNQKPDAPKELIDEANALLDRARIYGYKLITPQELYTKMQNKDALQILDASTKGDYLLGHLDGAKHLMLPKNFKWDEALNDEEKAKLSKKLGENLFIPIIVYDSGNDLSSQMGAADFVCIWAKKLGYTRVYRLVGGMQAWKAANLPTTLEKPSCCH